MDFLRIRQKARERAREHERQPAGAGEGAAVEEGLREACSPGPEPADPLDEFFWREDEVAPSLPDLVSAAALPQPREVAEGRREWLTFRLGEEEYALEIEHVREILKAPAITEVPRAPAHVVGITMVRGEVVAIFDPRRRLGLPPGGPVPRPRVLVCDAGDGPRGLLVDAVSQVVRLAPSAVEPRPPSIVGVSVDCIAGIGRERNKLFVLLDAAALLGDASPGGEAGEARA